MKLMVLAAGHSSGGDRDPLLFLKGKDVESLVEALIVGIPLFCFRFIAVALFTFVLFAIELLSDGRGNVLYYEGIEAHTGSYMTLVIRVQPGHVGVSPQSLGWVLEISERSPQGHG